MGAHHLVPRGGEVPHELLPCHRRRTPRRALAIPNSTRTQGQRPFRSTHLTRLAVPALVDLRVRRRRCPRRTQVDQVREEVVGLCPRLRGENTLFRPGVVVRTQHPQAADENRQLRSGQGQQVRFVDQQEFRRPTVALAEVVAEPSAVGSINLPAFLQPPRRGEIPYTTSHSSAVRISLPESDPCPIPALHLLMPLWSGSRATVTPTSGSWSGDTEPQAEVVIDDYADTVLDNSGLGRYLLRC